MSTPTGRIRGTTREVPRALAAQTDRSMHCGITLLAVSLAAAPYLVAWLTTPPGLIFVGHLSNPIDGLSYLAKMGQGARGDWFFHLPTTPEPHAGGPLFLYYLALGHFASLTGLSTVLVYHLARAGGGIALGLAAWSFLGRSFKTLAPRRFAFALFMLGLGFGWLTSPLGLTAVDLLLPEGFAFHSTLINPHFPLATAALLVVMPGLFEATRRVGTGGPRWRRLALRSAALVGAVVLQPFLIVPVVAVGGTWCLLAVAREQTAPRESVPRLVALIGPGAIVAGALASYAYLDPVLRQWSAQNITPSPPVWDYLLGFGWPALAVAGLGVAWLWRARVGLAGSHSPSSSPRRGGRPSSPDPFPQSWGKGSGVTPPPLPV
ncbi:MAG: hypothetical protein HYY04_08130, partial [Chloroflexi bacterium]|nr:hypothetical protein [Chloroflexota bacterium]